MAKLSESEVRELAKALLTNDVLTAILEGMKAEVVQKWMLCHTAEGREECWRILDARRTLERKIHDECERIICGSGDREQ